MTFLPIVERELRVAARRGGNLRLSVASGAVAVGAVIMLFSEYLQPAGAVSPGELGRYIFRGLAGLSMLYCLCSGRFSTVDSLSSERREGTLGLLFLTDLKGYDVVFGKLAATSVQAFYGLLAVFPVLAIPLLMGGVTYGEFWRMVLVLVDTFMLSLAIGMFASAFGRDFRQAAALNFLVILVLMALPPAGQGMWDLYRNRTAMHHGLFYSCPVYTFGLAFDFFYRTHRLHFWQSIATIHALTWVLILLANRRVPRSWQDKALTSGGGRQRGLGEFRRSCLYGNATTRAAFRKRCLDRNAFYWLAARVWSKPFQVWIFLALAAMWWAWGYYKSRGYWLDDAVYFTTAILLNVTLKIWVTIEAGQRIAEDKKAGAFELLLTTPLRSREILGGQLLALRRQFLPPLIVVLVIEFLLLFAPSRFTALSRFDRDLYLGAGMLLLLADLAALVGVVMFYGLTSGNAARSTARAISRVLTLPWLVLGLISLGRGLWMVFSPQPGWEAGPKFYLGAWVVLGLLTDWIFGGRAWRQLLARFGRFAEEQRALSRKEARKLAALARTADHARLAKPEIKSRWWLRRRTIVASLAVVCLMVAARYLVVRSRPKLLSPHPPPVLVQLGASNTAMRISVDGNGALFVLADGSLWEWGHTGISGPRFTVPQQVAPQSNWVEADVLYTSEVGITRDGQLWQWGNQWAGGRMARNIRMVPAIEAAYLTTNSARKWIHASTGDTHYAGLMDDGTLWAWGRNSQDELGNGVGADEAFPVQIGTDHDWAEVRALQQYTLALRKDGTLWAWGQVRSSWNRQPHTYSLQTPTRICADTNWVGFVPGSLGLVFDRAGDVWMPFAGQPDPDALAAENCGRIFDHYVPDRFASAFFGEARLGKLFQVRDDGTLWQADDPIWKIWMATAKPTVWTRSGARRDWVALWGGGGAVFGLTADGTLWTWGVDLGRDPVMTQVRSPAMPRLNLGPLFSTPATVTGVAWRSVRPYETEPWPLMKLVPPSQKPPGP